MSTISGYYWDGTISWIILKDEDGNTTWVKESDA
tara:strand:+ start:1063 stop:1164 length:102 start_codon:yes stop_codon:yes gene_type:complete